MGGNIYFPFVLAAEQKGFVKAWGREQGAGGKRMQNNRLTNLECRRECRLGNKEFGIAKENNK